MRSLRRIGGWTGGALLLGLFTMFAMAASPPKGARPSLPPVVELGVGGAPVSASREVLADLLQQIELLQTEIRNLRGQVEVQGHEIDRLKARQRELLADLDRRVTEMERRGTGAASSVVAPTTEKLITTAVSAPEQQDYDTAFTLMKQGYYERAAKGFRDFIAQYPQSELRDNAQYWLGEAFYVVRNYRQAIEEFRKVFVDYPKSPKAPDALLKTGYSYHELARDFDQAQKREEAGRKRPAELKRLKDEGGITREQAREHLNQVVTRYPGLPAAKSAEQRLASIKKEGS